MAELDGSANRAFTTLAARDTRAILRMPWRIIALAPEDVVFKRPSDQVLECQRRAAECSDRAQSAKNDQDRTYWLQQEAEWTDIAEHLDFSETLADYLNSADNKEMATATDAGSLDTLLSVYHRVCDSLDIDMHDESSARAIARTIIEAALAGEHDPEGLYERALRAVLTS